MHNAFCKTNPIQDSFLAQWKAKLTHAPQNANSGQLSRAGFESQLSAAVHEQSRMTRSRSQAYKRKSRAKLSADAFMVAPTRFEPATSRLERAASKLTRRRSHISACVSTSLLLTLSSKLAGVEGVEPSHTAPETAVLPLDDTPSPSHLLFVSEALSASWYNTDESGFRQYIFEKIAKFFSGSHDQSRSSARRGDRTIKASRQIIEQLWRITRAVNDPPSKTASAQTARSFFKSRGKERSGPPL